MVPHVGIRLYDTWAGKRHGFDPPVLMYASKFGYGFLLGISNFVASDDGWSIDPLAAALNDIFL